ncbi:insulin-like growth factor I isoform X1 [Zerene cesonia]|uniref:insulin-like growth factor I isoform X1 n=1 Tax=Zerene cesonia TaxID=33412 RepID=UPI0018E4F59B|nr:insulin-like growth factor I isoform X1 [Zerene cesonia]
MLGKNTACFAVITLVFMLDSRTDAATTSLKLCGRKLVEAMERVCKEYNSPPWDVPTVIEQPAGIVRRKRQMGIADQCCISTCHMTELLQYCAVIKLESPLEVMDEHMIEDRSAEASSASSPAVMAEERATGARREVGRGRHRGYGAKARGRRCWCRRKRRTGRRRTSLMGNMNLVKNAARAAPVVGTVSPLLTWGRTLNTDLPSADRHRYAYVAVYS